MNKLQYSILLLSVTAIWSSEIILMKNIPSDISPFAVLTMTNGIGSFLLGGAFFKKLRWNIDRVILMRAFILASMNVFYNTLIIIALRYMDPAAGSFIISFTLVMIPMILLFMRRRVTKSNLAGMALITLGIISAGSMGTGHVDIKGPVIMILVCVVRAVYLIKMNDFAKGSDPAAFSVLIGAMVTIISFLIWSGIQPWTFLKTEYSKEMLSSVVMDGFLVCGYAAFMNLTAQKYASPTTCSAIYSTQIIFAVVLAATVPEMLGKKDPITFAKIIGCIFIVAGTVCSELDLLGTKKRQKNA